MAGEVSIEEQLPDILHVAQNVVFSFQYFVLASSLFSHGTANL